MRVRLAMAIGVLGLSMLGPPGAAAAAPATEGKTRNTSLTPVAGELQALQQAYALMSGADHDYQGHRVRAMHAVEGACKLLGSSASGPRSGNEAQSASDAQLKQAATLLQTARSMAVSANQVRVVRHLDRALEQLSAALAVK